VDTQERSILDIWNELYAEDSIVIDIHQEDIAMLKKQLSQLKYKELKEQDDDTRLWYIEVPDEKDLDWVLLSIKLVNKSANNRTVRLRSMG